MLGRGRVEGSRATRADGRSAFLFGERDDGARGLGRRLRLFKVVGDGLIGIDAEAL